MLFRSDPFAYSVSPFAPPGVVYVYVEVARITSSGEEVLQPPTAQRLLPDATSFGFQVETGRDMMALFGYGRFVMRIYLDPQGPIYAQGRFHLVEPGLPKS